MAIIAITIPDDRVINFKLKFLKVYPNTELKLKAGTVPNPITGEYSPFDYEHKYTDNQWIKEWVVRNLKRAYKVGENQLYQNNLVSTDLSNTIV